jgi:hypothetical protein
LPGGKISQEDVYNQYILPITKEILARLGCSTDGLGEGIRVVPNPHESEDTTRVIDVGNIDRLIKESHQVSPELLRKVLEKIIADIINSLPASGIKWPTAVCVEIDMVHQKHPELSAI